LNGVPCKEGEFKEAIQNLAGTEETFRLLTNPRYFPDILPWQKRRELLLKVCGGDIKDLQVIASDPDLQALALILKDRKLEDHKKVIAGICPVNNRNYNQKNAV